MIFSTKMANTDILAYFDVRICNISCKELLAMDSNVSTYDALSARHIRVYLIHILILIVTVSRHSVQR